MLKLVYRISKWVILLRSSVYYKSVYYVIFMFIFIVFGYIFLDSGFNTKTKVKINYEDNSDIIYKVNYSDSSYKVTNDRYVSDLVSDIDIVYKYNNLVSEYISGYYRYNVMGYLITYEDDINNSLWEKKYQLLEDKTVLIDENNVNNIKIDDTINIDFNKYRDIVYDFIDNYGIDLNGYLSIKINIFESLNFSSLDNLYEDNKVITINIPLTDNVFKIDVNNINNKDSYYEFTSKKGMNIVLIIIGTVCVSFALSLLVLVIRQFKYIYNSQNEYNKELDRILSKYDDCIVKVKRFYVNKKYNLIYVDSFSELLDVYDKKNKMISFKEVKRNSESIFVIIDEDDAWIYKLINN